MELANHTMSILTIARREHVKVFYKMRKKDQLSTMLNNSVIKNKTMNKILLSTFLIFLSLVNCEWSEWQLGDCSATCGGGTRSDARFKLVTEQFGGVCIGEPSRVETCNPEECPSAPGNIKNIYLANKYLVMKVHSSK